jgi:hypothetical protein
MIMNYFRRVRPRNETEIEPIREVSNPFVQSPRNPFSRTTRDPFYTTSGNPFSSFDSSIYFVVKKVALAIAEENRDEFDLNAGDKKHTLVKRFIVYILNLANKAINCPKTAKRFLRILKGLPNRAQLIKYLLKLKDNCFHEGSIAL